ncbi:hypothetical protein KIPB_003270, partial [Kipferlia bialata]
AFHTVLGQIALGRLPPNSSEILLREAPLGPGQIHSQYSAHGHAQRTMLWSFLSCGLNGTPTAHAPLLASSTPL